MNENAPASRGVFRTGCVLPSAHRLLRRDRLHDAREHLVQRAHAVPHRQLAALAVQLANRRGLLVVHATPAADRYGRVVAAAVVLAAAGAPPDPQVPPAPPMHVVVPPPADHPSPTAQPA